MGGASISIRISTQTIEALIEASPDASLIANAEGGIICCNEAARTLLGASQTPRRLSDVFGSAEPLLQALRRARRSTSVVPVRTRPVQGDDDLRLNIRALPGGPGKSRELMLVTAVTRKRGNQRMLELKQRLEEAATEQRRLRDANRRLRDTVDNTLPRLQLLSTTDPLTGVHNRRYFDECLRKEWNRARRQDGMLALLYVDIDYFKRYNDALGHPEGDACLKRIADALQSAVTREFDRVCRIGGEEFALLLPMTTASGATAVGRRVLCAVRALAIPHPDAPGGIITVSVGVGACYPELGDDREEFVAGVDGALYRAKNAGRDCMAGTPGMLRHLSAGHANLSAPDPH